MVCSRGESLTTHTNMTSTKNTSKKLNFGWVIPIGVALFFVGGRYLKSENLGTRFGEAACAYKAKGYSDKIALTYAARDLKIAANTRVKSNFGPAVIRITDACGIARMKK